MVDDVYAELAEGFDRVASGWEKWQSVTGQRNAARYFDAAAIKPGDRVLEIGAGTGDQTLPLARLVGMQGRVHAVDLSSEMLAVTQRRVHHAGLDNVDFDVGTVGALALEPGSFDAAVSGFTWLFLPDPVAEAALLHRVLRPRGRFAASVWRPASEVPMMAVPMTAVLTGLGIDPLERLEATPMPLSDPDDFGNVWIEAGFEDVTVDEYGVDLTYETADRFADWVFDIVLPIGALIDEHAPGRQDEFHAMIAAAAATHADSDGTVTLSNPALMASGRAR
ncbi:MAG: class I SAM-dependent methyltransferase [Acidimicrobiia bacterium]